MIHAVVTAVVPGAAPTLPLLIWCDDSSPNSVSFLGMASETLVAMVILNSSDSDVGLSWKLYL